MLKELPDDKYVPCNACICCVTSITNPIDECKKDDPVFHKANNCICLCFSWQTVGQCRPKAPKGEQCLSYTFGCEFIDMFLGCTAVSIDCCCDSRQACPFNEALVPQALSLCCFVCLYKGEKKMLFGKKHSELGSKAVPTTDPINAV